ncbi:MAG: 30S ribosome-binding factor RbfA [Chloroflexi bacterium]|nr:30S ribosome-binding factor RbfA [Chloroflexota bacterium]
MTARRMDRVNALLRERIGEVLVTELSDPRLASVISVIRVVTSSDLRNAKVYVSVLGDDGQKQKSLEALTSASGFINRSVKKGVDLKYMPFLVFELDNSIEKGARTLGLIDEAMASESSDRATP